MNTLIKLLVILVVQLPATVLAQDTRPYELANADKRLNITYQQILLKLGSVDQAKLKKAQRAWIAFRDLDCTWAFGAEPLDCKIDRTERRTKELAETMFFDSKGNYLQLGDEGRK